MPRKPDPTRKPELLAQVIDFLLDKSLAQTSMRTLAEGLGISTYSLVYHFGSRAGLVHDIVAAIESRQDELLSVVTVDTSSVDKYFAAYVRAWEWGLRPRNQQLQRLEFEAAMIEALDSHPDGAVWTAFRAWHDVARDALVDLGLPDAAAAREGQLMVDTIFGLQFDLIVTRDVARVDALFGDALSRYRTSIEELLEENARRTG